MINDKKIDIKRYQKLWGLKNPIPFKHREKISHLESSEVGALGRFTPGKNYVLLRTDLVKNGIGYSSVSKEEMSLNGVYIHECGHFLAWQFMNSKKAIEYEQDNKLHTHRLFFAAMTAFLYSKIPGDFSIDDFIKGYEVHQIEDYESKYQSKKRSIKAAIQWAINTGYDLAQTNLTIKQAANRLFELYQDNLIDIHNRKISITNYKHYALAGGLFCSPLAMYQLLNFFLTS